MDFAIGRLALLISYRFNYLSLRTIRVFLIDLILNYISKQTVRLLCNLVTTTLNFHSACNLYLLLVIYIHMCKLEK